MNHSVQLFPTSTVAKQEVKHTCGPLDGYAQPPPHPDPSVMKGRSVLYTVTCWTHTFFRPSARFSLVVLSMRVPVRLLRLGALSHCCLYRLTLFSFFFLFFFMSSAAGGQPSSLLAAASVRPRQGPQDSWRWTQLCQPSGPTHRWSSPLPPSLPPNKCL